MVLVIRRLRADERGVASTVGTVMALLVFLMFLSLIVNQYVPAWMNSSEANHMDGAVGQFADLKGAIDFQVLGALMSQNAGAIYIPSTASTSVTLGVDGVPLFSSPTAGTLASSNSSVWSIHFQSAIHGVLSNVFQNASGQIDLNIQNRYYAPGDIVYDNGAVIRSQPDGQVIRAAPVFQATQSGTNLSVAFELVSLYGSGVVSGTSTQVVNTKVFGVNQQAFGSLASNLYINHTSAYGPAWFSFLNSTLSSSVTIPSYNYNVQLATGVITVATTYYKLTLTPNAPQAGIYTLAMVIYSTSLSLSFTLQQAYVDVGVTPTSNNV